MHLPVLFSPLARRCGHECWSCRSRCGCQRLEEHRWPEERRPELRPEGRRRDRERRRERFEQRGSNPATKGGGAAAVGRRSLGNRGGATASDNTAGF